MTTHRLHTLHQRSFDENKFVYPVLSRRSRGLSVGVNLNPDKICNFDCIYCQVNRREESETRFVETDRYFREVDEMLSLAASGDIWRTPKFAETPAHLRRVNDIAFSGDGEPTTYRNFDELVGRTAEIKRQHGMDDVKMVLITNASMFHRDVVKKGLEVLDANNGEIWAKLDAGTEAYYQLIERTKIPYQRILDNLTAAAQVRPLVIQTLFMKVNGVGPSDEELAAYCGRLRDVTAAGGTLKLIQIYTVARRPAEDFVGPISDAEVDRIVKMVQDETGLAAEAYYGTTDY
ncbi:radical SAM protein [Blastopirellula retiformator]|uniref:Radical SAM superfamily protein n=1 Tax=Blastopirellula retiformator TaxID=2527970 RepID=A0A5C5VPB6_9BACT|nr:radical SAM protein [Blastopirellula retiformator]TWT39661.1 Radical SAM superfamily protein [Blastopirellula retiformator]